MRVTAELDLRQIMREIQWALPGLLLRIEGRSEQKRAALHERARTALSLLATTLEQPRFRVACNAAVTELASHLGCDQVSLGVRRGRRTRVVAISQSGDFSRKAELVQRVADCMDEAIDQRLPIVFPEQRDDLLVVTAAHDALAALGRRRTIATVPMTLGDRIVGALTLERPEEAVFDAETLNLLDVVASILGPILEEKRLNDRPIPVKLLASARDAAAAVLGPRRLGLKLALLAAAVAMVALWRVETDFRVTADARIEGSVRRVIAAPLDGYVQSVAVRAGDLVEEGQTMATLDDREIALELRRWQSVKAQREREYQTALSARNPSQLGIIATQIGQAEAEIALLEERRARTRLAAPFDGIVLSGDLDQSVGAPVTRGRLLFEIAPLDAYRVILSVDERDLAEVSPGLEGSLVLTALPGTSYPMRTGRVTSVASVEDGRNVFRVEAEILGEPEELRPGMKGLAKIDIDRRPLAVVWTRNAVNWLRLALWRWVP
jgi:RND family efflux transporter MFP subunit